MGRLAGLVGIALLSVMVYVLVLSTWEGESGAVSPAAVPAQSSAETDAPTLATPSRRLEVPHATQEATTREVATLPGPAAVASDPPVADVLYPLVVTCVRGDRRSLQPESIEVALTRVADGRRVVISSIGSRTAVGEIALGVWELSAFVPGYRHVTATHEFKAPARFEDSTSAPLPTLCVKAYLWPDDWIPVIARIPRGLSLTELAREHGLESEDSLVNAFSVKASYYEMMGGLGAPGMEQGPLCRFHPPQKWRVAEVPGSVIGSLEILQPRPFWVTLTFFKGIQIRRQLLITDREIVFDLDDFDFEHLGGRVNLRVVDRGTGAPIAGARVTLEPELLARQAAALEPRESDAGGNVEFTHVLPGRHKLLITHGEHRAWRHLELHYSPNARLGDVRIGGGADVLVRVVDTDGRPAPSVIEIAPFVPSGFVDDLYELDVSRTTEADGSYMLPLPDGPSIVRARPLYLRGPERDYETVGTRNVLLDPDDPPNEIVLIAQLPVEVKIDVTQARAAWEDGQQLNLVDTKINLRGRPVIYRVLDPSLPIWVIPGGYYFERWDGSQRILSQGEGKVVMPRPTTITLR